MSKPKIKSPTGQEISDMSNIEFDKFIKVLKEIKAAKK